MMTLPNLISGLSLVCGFASVILSLERHFTLASWAIIISVVCDGLDGQIARLCKSSSDFGKELDSLVDVICFGMAPSILGYIFVYKVFHMYATIALFLYLCASVVRLAKYNITPKEKMQNFFYGLPTTASGGMLAAFILIYRTYTELPPHGMFLFLALVLAFLMVSRIKYPNLDALKGLFTKKSPLGLGVCVLLLVVLGVVSAITGKFAFEAMIIAAFLMYLLFSPFMVKSVNAV